MTSMTDEPLTTDLDRAKPDRASAARARSLRRRRAAVVAPVGKRAIWRAARVPRSTLALLAISIVLPLILFALAAMQNRADVIRAAEHRVERTTRILHEHTLKIFETHELMIDQINERLRVMDWSKPEDVASLHDLLAHLEQLLPQVADIIITDADGNVRADSLHYPLAASANVADRDYFKALKQSSQALPYISRAAIGRESGEPVFNMAARITGPVKGAFAGVVSIAINQMYFGDFYSEIEREYHHLVILAREDGSILASEPPIALDKLPSTALFRPAGDSRSHNTRVYASTVDGVSRMFGDEKVGRYPVVIGFGISWTSALRPWWRNMWGYGLVAALSSLALLGVSGVAIRRIALEGKATVRWRRSAALLETEIAERAAIEEQLRQSQKMEAVGRLTGGIAHDFNNLLTVVIGSLDMLSRRMRDADPRHQALVKNAIDGASRAAGLTSRLLAFSRQQPLDPKPLSANMLITGMSNMLARTMAENVSFDLQLADDLWQTFADPNQLENAILNLCVNAVDAMPKGGVLTLSTANAQLDAAFCARHDGLSPGSYVAISVEDTGTGMPAEVIEHAFEPFFTTKPVGKGTGLGLSQVYGFALQSGGSAEIETQIERGTRIRIYLPRVDVSALAIADSERPPAARDGGAIVRGSATVLIVEDDDLVRGFSSNALREAGYDVLEATTGPDGLGQLRAHDGIALLFTDVVLKGPMNGRELADQALAHRPDLPVLFTTGYTRDTVIHHAGRLDEGVNLLIKPFTAAVLAARIAELLQRRETVDAPSERRAALAGSA